MGSGGAFHLVAIAGAIIPATYLVHCRQVCNAFTNLSPLGEKYFILKQDTGIVVPGSR